jgi:hypothetical protein
MKFLGDVNRMRQASVGIDGDLHWQHHLSTRRFPFFEHLLTIMLSRFASRKLPLSPTKHSADCGEFREGFRAVVLIPNAGLNFAP